MNYRLAFALLWAAVTSYGADPRDLWEQAVKAKGGHERLRAVHSLAVYMKPAEIVMTGPPETWLFVFPNRYFEYDGRGPLSTTRSVIVDGAAERVSMDVNGMPRATRRLGQRERDQFTWNQLVYLLETAWLQPQPVAAQHNALTVEAGGRSFRLSLSKAYLPERIWSLPNSGEKRKTDYDYHLQRYRAFQGVFLPTRVASTAGTHEWTWDVDYEIDAKYNPKLFERQANLDDGPEPWRQR